jgi:RHS repeat-associated protein
LPKGGGAIRGIGEKFAANPVTGTGSLTVPIATSPGRSGFGPQLSLAYDSGAGNGPFGFGWSLSLPTITRKTDKGLPRYLDGGKNQPDSDLFILSGAEDLVPVFRQDKDGNWLRDQQGNFIIHEDQWDGCLVRRYRPRMEGLFARIERWTNPKTGEIHWRSISRDNITTLYGRTAESRIADPADPTRAFSWLICASYDDKGNAIVYEYAAENDENVERTQGNERNRVRTANRYIKRIKYGNRRPNRDANWQVTDPSQLSDWMFEVVFDYTEDHYKELDLDPDRSQAEQHRFVHASASPVLPWDSTQRGWPTRSDQFSSYRAGFEVRTCRLCRRVLMFHHFPQELGIDDCLVRSTEFSYAESPIASFISSVTQSGYVRRPIQNQPNRYLKKSLPPLEFEYSRVPGPEQLAQQPIQEVDAESLENLPYGLDGASYQWVDLDGEGTSGILTEQADGWFYKRNLSANNQVGEDDAKRTAARFGPVELVATKPAAGLSGGQSQFLDLAGDGQVDLVQMEGPLCGFYERTDDPGWVSFRPFVSWPNIDTHDPNLRFVDLDGDGHADVLITEHEAFTWYPSLAEEGFGAAQHVPKALDEEHGPRLVFADGAQSVYLADLSGDGLTDLVRIRNGEVCYWPNLGYGRFGAKVTMDNAPWFDMPDQFDQRRIRLADVDGSGVTDILYLRRDGVQVYFNQSGNRWDDAATLSQFPVIDNLASVQALDLLGNGTACLVWSSSLPGTARRPMRYIDLMARQEPHPISGQKPHLLIKVINNLGAETHVQYAPSTKFYLDDKLAGKPWITKLPFPVHVMERVETYDCISRSRFVTRYAYHHGYFDGEEREFRGFGMVEQRDTEEIGTVGPESTKSEDTNWDDVSFVPPVLTRTWFHTGAYLGRDHVSDFFAGLLDGRDIGEYYREPGLDGAQARELLLDDTVLPSSLTPDEEREACRALKGMMLRQEVYADDAPPGSLEAVIQRARIPYSVVEQNFTIRRMQPRADNRHAVFFTHPREVVTYHYERTLVPVLNGQIVDEVTAAANATTRWLPDPRVQHALTLEVDNFGNVLNSAAIGYGRRFDAADTIFIPEDWERQRLIHMTCTQNIFTNSIDQPDTYRTPMPAETRTYELRRPEQEKSGNGLTSRYQSDDLLGHVNQAGDGNHDVDYEDIQFAKAKQAVANAAEEAEKYFRRLIERVRTLYRKDDLTALLPLGELPPLALPGESYKLAFTSGLLDQVYVRDGQALLPANADDVLVGGGADRGGYVDLDGDGSWWIPTGRISLSPDGSDTAAQERAYAQSHFFLPHRYRDPFAESTTVRYDRHDLLLVETTDPLGNVVIVETEDEQHAAAVRNDYRVLQPFWVTDPNGNRTRVAFDALGMVVGTAVMGKPGQKQGDLIDSTFESDLDLAVIQDFVKDPRGKAGVLLKQATTRIVYDLDRFNRCRQPPLAAALARETHFHDPGGAQTKIQISFSYSDGFGREIQKKIQAEAGDAPQCQPDMLLPTGDIGPGDLVRDAQGKLVGASAPHRWVGTGRTIYNNKGKPIKKYEPFFSSIHLYESESDMTDTGVTPILFYDPLERVVATLHPNHTYEKVVFDPWQQTTWDVNDTVTLDPSSDDDVKGFFVKPDGTPRVPTTEYLPTWYSQRINATAATQPRMLPRARASGWLGMLARKLRARLGARIIRGSATANEGKGTAELDAAQKAAEHANTPTVAYFDTLGRPFLTMAHDKFKHEKPDGMIETVEEKYLTRIHLDIEGNQREVGDAKDRVVMRYDYDILGNRIHQASMEAGERWMLNDVTSKPIRSWDSRRFIRRMTYDELRRPTGLFVTENGAERLAERTVYGEDQGDADNHRTRLYQVFDGAGIVTSVAYDFKGNLLRTTRRLVADYKNSPNWSGNPTSEAEEFVSSIHYDALNRRIQIVAPHSNRAGSIAPININVIRPGYNEANLLEQVDVWLELAAEPPDLLDPVVSPPSRHGVKNIDYNAKGQRVRVEYKNNVTTSYTYDDKTFRLTHLYTRRGATFTEDCGNDPPPPRFAAPDKPQVGIPCGLQNIHYTYDPVGNITSIRDDAQQTVYFNGQVVPPHCDYTYDAIYRLIKAEGREHSGQVGQSETTWNDEFRVRLQHPHNGQAMQNYTERYEYDAVGNFEKLLHQAANGNWTRSYTYNEDSLAEPAILTQPAKKSNRLSSTTVGSNNTTDGGYVYDAHGNKIRMPHLANHPDPDAPNMHWDYNDQLQQTDLGGGGTAYYIYDAGGQRVRKVWEKAPGLTEERIYLGGFEVYRKHTVGDELERETLHLMHDQQRIALVETRTIDTAGADPGPRRLVRYQHGNHLGSAVLELDDQAKIISYEEYYPYGSTSYQAVRTDIEVPLKRYRYTGKERDEESGLYYHGARYYAPWLGRWITCDPSGVVDGPNIYCFTRSNPVVLRDLTGHNTMPSQQELDKTVLVETLYSDIENLGPEKRFEVKTRMDMEFRMQEIRREMSLEVIGEYHGQFYQGSQYGYRLFKSAVDRQRSMAALDAMRSSPTAAVVSAFTDNPEAIQFAASAEALVGIGAFARYGGKVQQNAYDYSPSPMMGMELYPRQATSASGSPPPPMPRSETAPLVVNPLRGVDYSRSEGLDQTEKKLLEAARQYFKLPPQPTASKRAIVGVLLIEGMKPMPFHSGVEGGPWGGAQRGNIPRGPGSGMDRYSAAHVEGHAVAKMWELGQRNAVLLLEKDPCTQCDRNLPQMLPMGGSLSVVSPSSTAHYRSSW